MENVSGLTFSAEQYQQLLWHVRAALPREAVGLLGGSVEREVSLVVPLTNIAAGNRSFIAEPFEQFSALRRLQAENLQLLAIYHSHPDGGLDASEDDLAYARRWRCAHLIVALNTHAESGERVRAFECDESGRIDEVDIRCPSIQSRAR